MYECCSFLTSVKLVFIGGQFPEVVFCGLKAWTALWLCCFAFQKSALIDFLVVLGFSQIYLSYACQ